MELIAIQVTSTPAMLTANFEEFRRHLGEKLAQYDVLVTAETLADAKKLATELNQAAKAIDERRKEAVAAVSEPIRQFDERMKELVGMCKESRQKLLAQIQTFEDETRERARALLEERRAALWEKHDVAPEFRRATVDDLVMITAVTKAGNLANKQATELEGRVLADKALQDRTERRLLALENASYKAGLSAPLTRDHVAAFLMADEETYQRELERIIDAEMRREEMARQRMREQMEREQREREEREAAERARIEREVRAEQEAASSRNDDPAFNEAATGDLLAQADYYDQHQQEQYAAQWDEPVAPCEPASAPQTAASTKVRIIVRATFHPEVPAGATDEQIKAALRSAMAKAGITTLSGIEIIRPQEDAEQ